MNMCATVRFLLEIGTDANSIDEVEYTAQLLANVLYNVLGE